MHEIIAESELFEAQIPDTTYGYWITPDGTFHPVGYQYHTKALRNLIGYGSTLKTAFELGWIRVGSHVKEAPDQLFVQFIDGALTARSLSGIRQLSQSQDFIKYYLTVVTYEDGFSSREFVFGDGVNDRAHFMLAVREHGSRLKQQAA